MWIRMKETIAHLSKDHTFGIHMPDGDTPVAQLLTSPDHREDGLTVKVVNASYDRTLTHQLNSAFPHGSPSVRHKPAGTLKKLSDTVSYDDEVGANGTFNDTHL
jgi:hypothetical protein